MPEMDSLMSLIPEWLLMPEWLLALALTLFVVDFFVPTEIMSWFGLFALSGYLTWRINVPLPWCILVFVLALTFFSLVYYFVFRVFVSATFAKFLQRNAPPERINAISGAVGEVHFVGGKPMFRWNGDELWPIRNPPQGAIEGMSIVANRLVDGFVEIEPFISSGT